MHIPRKTASLEPRPVLQCHRCAGTGRVTCQFCSGKGVVMLRRDMQGNPIMSRCTACFGIKTARCHTCGASGYV